MTDENNGTGVPTLKQGPGTTPSGWDYVDAIMDALPPSIEVGALSIIGGALVPSFAPYVWAPTVVVGISQFASYLRGIYKGTRASVQV